MEEFVSRRVSVISPSLPRQGRVVWGGGFATHITHKAPAVWRWEKGEGGETEVREESRSGTEGVGGGRGSCHVSIKAQPVELVCVYKL